MSGKLETLRPMLAQSLDVIQVNGLCLVGTPVGPKDNVREYVRNKCGTICSANLPHGGAWLHDGQVLADHDTWSNPQLQALVQTHARLIQEYRCVERQLQGPAPAAPVVDQGPQVNTPLLIPPLNQLAQLRAARAHGKNAENAQKEAAQGLRMLDQRRITAAIMKYWAPHVEALALGPPHHRGKVMHPR
jgi:hypothetical protein